MWNLYDQATKYPTVSKRFAVHLEISSSVSYLYLRVFLISSLYESTRLRLFQNYNRPALTGYRNVYKHVNQTVPIIALIDPSDWLFINKLVPAGCFQTRSMSSNLGQIYRQQVSSSCTTAKFRSSSVYQRYREY